MAAQTPGKPRLILDADVLFTGAASPNEHSASHVILRMAEITLVEAFTCEQVIAETERNLADKIPKALPLFQSLVQRCLHIVPDASPEGLIPYLGMADPEDLPILVAAVQHHCPWLVTYNLRHYQPGINSVTVLTPGDFVLQVRSTLSQL